MTSDGGSAHRNPSTYTGQPKRNVDVRYVSERDLSLLMLDPGCLRKHGPT